MRNHLILFFTVFLTGLIWLILVPIWHFPDEQAHFGQVAFIAEKGRNPRGNELDLTEEIYVSEKLLGTTRDNLGNNKFTFHPEYRIEYTDSLIGKYEASIAAFTKTSAKNTFVHQEAARYPQLYYIPASVIYKLFYTQDLFTRVFAVRFWSLLLFTITVYITYKIGTLLFPTDKLFAQVLTILVGFQPMMVFSNVGVNSDALGNLIFTLFIFSCLQLISFGLSKKSIILSFFISSLAIYAKPQFIVTVPIIFFLFIFIYIRDHQKTPWHKIIVKSSVLLFLSLLLLNLMRLGTVNLIIETVVRFNLESFIKFTREYTLTHTVSEVLPWYWGVYDWLGVTYPRSVHRIINRILAVSLIGFIYWLMRSFRKENRKKKEVQSIYFLILINLIFFGALAVYDWYSWYTTGYQLGVQGRYYFPLISTHMIILLIGWQSLFVWIKKLKYLPVLFLEISMITLNFVALYTISVTYYSLSSFSVFISQVSQYKPWFVKGPVLVFIFILLLFTLIKLIYQQVISLRNMEMKLKSDAIKRFDTPIL